VHLTVDLLLITTDRHSALLKARM